MIEPCTVHSRVLLFCLASLFTHSLLCLSYNTFRLCNVVTDNLIQQSFPNPVNDLSLHINPIRLELRKRLRAWDEKKDRNAFLVELMYFAAWKMLHFDIDSVDVGLSCQRRGVDESRV